jgi:hypothetical protein
VIETTPVPQAPGEKPGKTFADVADSILSDRNKFLSAVSICGLIVLVCLGCIALLVWFFGLSPSQVQINTLGGQITLQTTSGNQKSTLVMVHPQGWENTNISVHDGQKFGFNAEGKVSIDGYSLIKAYKLLGDLEDHYKQRLPATNANMPDDQQRAPEQYYTGNLRLILRRCLNRLWTEPDGFNGSREKNEDLGDCPDISKLEGRDKDRYHGSSPHPDEFYTFPDQDYPGRTQRKIMPNQPYGKLIGAVRRKEDDDTWTTLERFAIGSRLDKYVIKHQGELFLIVNDVLDENDKDKEESKYYYYDNVGFFIVNIVTRD